MMKATSYYCSLPGKKWADLFCGNGKVSLAELKVASVQLEKIIEYFFTYANEQGKPYKEFPLGTEIEEFGAPFIEISASGKLALVARDRGTEQLRKETMSPEVMAKWVFELFSY
ncbi:hypothetical protein [Pseudomonas sp. TWP3-2]|uniref:hypothetical protein n=1 Tax=Pseudomonas sp. TWP3-2 TaxID=2804574 RepID=UPI003CF740C4